MALKYYSDAGLTTEITTLTTEHDSAGETKEVQVYLGNLDPSFTYHNIIINIEDTSTPPDETNWIELALDDNGSPGTYGNAGDPLSFPDIIDQNPHSFWIRVTTPMIGSAQNKTDLRLRTAFQENAV